MAQKSATVAIVSNNKLLILRRGPTAPWKPGCYCLPGGKKEGNESLIECAIRELSEETGIYIVDSSYLIPHTVTYQSKYSKIIFVTKMLDPPVALNWEHDHYAWISKEQTFSYPLVPGLPTTIKSLVAHGWLM
jgi:8-oxo-dGTP pyrophosphatase MutT (NUDIX family)